MPSRTSTWKSATSCLVCVSSSGSQFTVSELSLEAEAFAAWVREGTEKPVTFYDERYTSRQAEEVLLSVDMSRKKRKARRDMIAAQIILQGYLDYG